MIFFKVWSTSSQIQKCLFKCLKIKCVQCSMSSRGIDLMRFCLHCTVFWQAVFHPQSSYSFVASIFQVFFQPLFFPRLIPKLSDCVWHCMNSNQKKEVATWRGNQRLFTVKCSKLSKWIPLAQVPEDHEIIAGGRVNDHVLQFYYFVLVYRYKFKGSWYSQ